MKDQEYKSMAVTVYFVKPDEEKTEGEKAIEDYLTREATLFTRHRLDQLIAQAEHDMGLQGD